MRYEAPAEPNVVAVSVAGVAVPDDIEVSPAATPDELAVILTAYEALWPDPAPAASTPVPSEWRFAGRWWMGIGPRAAMPSHSRPTL